jgi:hypothetical protein
MIKDSYGNARFYGVYRGTVFDTKDPQNLGRIQVRIPQILADQATQWAWPVEKYGADTKVPAIGQGVWVVFEGGDPSYPIWMGTFGGSTIVNQPTNDAPSEIITEDFPTPVPSIEVAFTVAGGAVSTQPTFTGTPLFTGSYVRTGAQVHFRIDVEFDNITSFGTGQYYLDLPFRAKGNYQFAAGCLHDISTSRDYPIFGHVATGETRMYLKSIDAQGNSAYNVPFTYNTPTTLSTADNFHISGDYITDEAI